MVKNSLRAWHRRLDPRQAQPRGPPSFGLPVSPSKQSTCLCWQMEDGVYKDFPSTGLGLPNKAPTRYTDGGGVDGWRV